MNVAMRGSKQRYAGGVFIAIGGAAAVLSQNYPLGTARMMGPGYFPLCLGILLMALGVIAITQTWFREQSDPVARLTPTPLFFLILGVAAFGLTIDVFGLVPAIFGLIACTCYQRLLRKPFEVLAIFGVLAILAVGLFVYVLKLPFTAF